MSALHTHTPATHKTHTPCPEFTVLLQHSGKLNFTLLPPVTHTHTHTESPAPCEGSDFK